MSTRPLTLTLEIAGNPVNSLKATGNLTVSLICNGTDLIEYTGAQVERITPPDGASAAVASFVARHASTHALTTKNGQSSSTTYASGCWPPITVTCR